jgi:hypothetical protein
MDAAQRPLTISELTDRVDVVELTPARNRRRIGWVAAGVAAAAVILLVGALPFWLSSGPGNSPADTTAPTLTADEQTMFGVLLEVGEILDSPIRISVDADVGLDPDPRVQHNLEGRFTLEDTGGFEVIVMRFDSEALAAGYIDDQVSGVAEYDPDFVTLPAPQGWDQSIAIGFQTGRGGEEIDYLVRHGEWVLRRPVGWFRNEDLEGTQELAIVVFGAVDSAYSPSITLQVEEWPPPPDSYESGYAIVAPLPGYGDGEDEREFQGLAWGTEYTQRPAHVSTCTTWHEDHLVEDAPTLRDSYGAPNAGVVTWTDSDGSDSLIPSDDPAYLSALEECTRYPVDAASWGVQLPDDPPTGLQDLSPLRVGPGEYVATERVTCCHEVELDHGHLVSIGWIEADSSIEVVSAIASVSPGGLTSIYADLRGPTAALGEYFGVDLSDLGPGPIDVAFSMETFSLDTADTTDN